MTWEDATLLPRRFNGGLAMFVKVLLSICLMLSMLLATLGQQPTPSPKQTPTTQEKPPDIDSQDVVKITTNLVQIDVTVTKDGKPVTDLRPEDFEISEDGKPQVITNFSYISNLPAADSRKPAPAPKSIDARAVPVPPAKINPGEQRRIVALVVDDFGISFESMAQVRSQMRKFIDDLSPNDLVAIIRTGGDIGSLQQFTNDKRVLQSALDRLRWNPCSRAGLNVFQPAGPKADDDFNIPEASNTGVCSEVMVFS